MSLRKDKRSPYWQFDFTRKGQRFYGSTGCTTKRDAERYEAEQKRRIALGEQSRPQITLDEACEHYWTDKGQHENSRVTTEYQLANLCTIIGAQRLLRDIRQKDFRDYIATRRKQKARNSKQPVSPSSVNREWQLARRVWKHALAGGFDVPLPGTKEAIVWKDLKLAEPEERVRDLAPADEAKLFAQLDPDLLAVVEFALLSAQRKTAVIRLRWDRVDLDGMRATVHTKGDQWHTFPLTDRMAEIIKGRPEVEGCPYVFTYECARPSPRRPGRPHRTKGKRYPFSTGGWARKWHKALADAGIEDFRFHDLRHTRATRVLRATGNLKVIQKLLGHSDIATTARYAHAVENDVRSAMTATDLRNNHGKRLRATRASAKKTAESEAVE